MLSASVLSFCIGFLSLSIEILWVRLFGFANYSLPQAFAFVLVFYLIGIAIGARIGKYFCESKPLLWLLSGKILLIASFVCLVSPWLYVYSLSAFPLLGAALLITITAALTAVIFPIAHHLGFIKPTVKPGRQISTVYVANILGATLGPLVTGAFLLDFFTTQQCYIIFASLLYIVSLYCFILQKKIRFSAYAVLGMVLFISFFFWTNPHSLITKIADRSGQTLQVIENKSGIITLYEGGSGGDLVFGGNVYDGRTNLDPLLNTNGINRLLVLAALHEQPKRVLMIGLSIGTWLKIVTSFPGVEQIDVIEINPAYLQAIQNYPRLAAGLLDARVHLYIDDGRRWLRAHADNQYDLIIMNTTFYWRAYTSNLLSQNFLALIKQHMHANAILAFNTTGSPDALKTAVSIFKNAYLYQNFVIAADFDWRTRLYQQRAIEKLAALSLDGHLLFPFGSKPIIESFLRVPLSSLKTIQPMYEALGRQLEIITDNNLITEYKYGISLQEINQH